MKISDRLLGVRIDCVNQGIGKSESDELFELAKEISLLEQPKEDFANVSGQSCLHCFGTGRECECNNIDLSDCPHQDKVDTNMCSEYCQNSCDKCGGSGTIDA